MDVTNILKDPNFQNLPEQERVKVLIKFDPNFASLPNEEQMKAVSMLKQQGNPDEEPYTEAGGGFLESLPNFLPEKSPISKEFASKIYTPLLEGGGAVGGALLAGQGLPTPQGILGGMGGYLIGKGTARKVDELIGLKEPQTLPEIVKEIPKDAAMGLAYEFGGHSVGPILRGVKEGGKWALKKMDPVEAKKFVEEIVAANKARTVAHSTAEAEGVLTANTSKGVVFAANEAEARALEESIPGLKFSTAERTNDPNLIKLQRAQERLPGSAASLKQNQRADNIDALRNYRESEFPGPESIDDVKRLMKDKEVDLNNLATSTKETALRKTPESIDPQTTGTRIVESIKKAEQPIKKGMSELKKEIPDYPMQFENLRAKIAEIKNNKQLSLEKIRAVEALETDLMEIISKRGKSTFTGMGLRRTINDKISKYINAGEDWSAAILQEVKDSLEADFSQLSKRTASGELVEYNGKTVEPDKIASMIEDDSKRLAIISGKQKPDLTMMRKELSDVGQPTMRVTHEGTESYEQRIIKSYKARFGKDVPYTSDKSTEKMVSDLKTRIANNKEILSKASPGQDVAASLRAYNEFATTEYFGRFDKPTISRATGRKAESGKIPNYFTTADGADDLINAVGKAEASGIMKGHYAYDMLYKARDPLGVINANKLANWYKSNKIPIEKYGLEGYFEDIVKANKTADAAQAAVKDFERSMAKKVLNADPQRVIAVSITGNTTEKAMIELLEEIGDNEIARRGLKNAFADHVIDSAKTTAETIKGDPTTSQAAFAKLMTKYAPAMKILYKDEPRKIMALQNMQKAYKIMSRSATSPMGGGSDTAENISTMLSKMSGAASGLSRTANIIRFVTSWITKGSKTRTNEILNQMLFNPDAAYATQVILKGKGGVDEKAIAKILNRKVISMSDYQKAITAQAATAAGIVLNGASD